jgi:DNA polymerase-3 subunit beta
MKFTCNKDTILKEIALALDFTTSKNALSILSHVALETKNNQLIIKATDQKMGFKSIIEVETVNEGQTCVYCDKLLGILRNMPDDTIVFEEKNGNMRVSHIKKAIDFDLRTVKGDKFPELQESVDFNFFSLPQKDFFDMVDQTIFAISDDEIRFFMNGIFMEQDPNGLVMVATDGKRLSYINRKLENPVPSFTPVIIPAPFLNILKKVNTNEGSIELALGEAIIFVKLENQIMYSNLIKGQFPNYRRVIPASQSNTCKFAIKDMNEALKRVSLLVENKAKRIFIDIEQNKITVSSEESEFGQAQEVINADYSGGNYHLALNYSYLVSPLKIMDGETCALCFTEPNKAVTVRPEPELDYFHIIMPMQID